MSIGARARSLLPHAGAILCVGIVPAWCFSLAWDLGFLVSHAILVYGTALLGCGGCVAYALFEWPLRGFAGFFTGLLAAASVLAIGWSFLTLPLLVIALLPISTAVVLVVWARRAARAADESGSGAFLFQSIAGIAAILLLPLALQTWASSAEASVTRAVIDGPDERALAVVSDVGPWKHVCAWEGLREAVRREAGGRPGDSGEPEGVWTPRAQHLWQCYRELAGDDARVW